VSETARDVWDREATTFDDEPDHGLRDPLVRRAWTARLLSLLPAAPSRVLDVGCGTGSVSVLLAAAGHEVCGVDVSGRMLDRARAKAAAGGVPVAFVQGDAGRLPFAPASFEVLFARHLLWAFDDPDAVLAGWVEQLAPRGRLVLVEGRWSTGAGLSVSECRRAVARHRREVTVDLLDDPALWGGPIRDERYLVYSAR
jgi:SAM-dependent methyltransferase